MMQQCLQTCTLRHMRLANTVLLLLIRAATPTSSNASAALDSEATSGDNQRLNRERTTIAFSTAVAIAVLPTLLLLGRMGWHRLRRGVDGTHVTEEHDISDCN